MTWRTFGGFVLVIALVAGAGCFRNTRSVIELDIPAMKSERCAQVVREAVSKIGDEIIYDIKEDVEARKVWVTYDNQRLGRRNIEVTVRHAGFAVNDLPANEDARAKLSPECRGHE